LEFFFDDTEVTERQKTETKFIKCPDPERRRQARSSRETDGPIQSCSISMFNMMTIYNNK
jgi:hypothetical protein